MDVSRESNREGTRQALIRSGLELLTERGFSGTGIDTILKRVGVPKGSFYHFFGSKDDFGLHLIEEFDNFYRHVISSYLKTSSRDPLDRIEAMVAGLSKSMENYQFRRGCLVGNFAQELGATNPAFRVRLEAALQGWEALIADCLEEGKLQGGIARHIESRDMAAFFWTGWEGAVLRAKLTATAEPLFRFGRHFVSLIRAEAPDATL